MRKYVCLLVLCIASITIAAQETREMKIVQLKSGITVTGYVTNNDDGSIILTTTDGDQLFYQAAEVKSIDYLEKPDKQKKQDENSTIKDKRFQLMIEGFGSDKSIGFFVTPSLCFKNKIIVGVGLGAAVYENYDSNFLCKIIGRYLFLEKSFTPYLGIETGFGRNAGGFQGLMAGVDLGCMIRNKKGGGLQIGIIFDYLIDDSVGFGGLKLGWTF